MSKKRVSGAWVDDTPHIYNTSTDTFSTLPHEVIGDGTAISSYTIKGNKQQSGTPTPSNPVFPTEVGEKTANLSPETSFNKTTELYHAITLVEPLPVGTYTLSADITPDTGISSARISFRKSDLSQEVATNIDIQNGRSTVTITISNPCSAIYFYGSTTVMDNIPIKYEDIMLNTGSTALPYQPYGYKIPILSNGTTYPVYLSEPIRKISTYADECVSTGTANRVVKKLVFDGTEEGWRRSSAYNGSFFCGQSLTGILGTTIEAYCSHAVFTPTVSAQDYTQGKFAIDGTFSAKTFNIYYDNGTVTLADFKQWLADQYAAGTPVTVWYVLATAQTESFTAPTIPTSGTAQSFDVDTTLKPSEVSLTYHGWHEHEDTKYTTP